MTADEMQSLADKINAHLAAGKRLVVGTYIASQIYSRSHAGAFVVLSDGALAVKIGKRTARLSSAGMLMCGFRFVE